MHAHYSKHAQTRSQQRGIPADVVDLIEAFGTSRKAPGSRLYRFIPNARLDRVLKVIGREQFVKMEPSLKSAYLVEDRDGKLVTIAHKQGRFRNIH